MLGFILLLFFLYTMGLITGIAIGYYFGEQKGYRTGSFHRRSLLLKGFKND